MLVRPGPGSQQLVDERCGGMRSPRRQSTAASDQNAITARSSRASSVASAPTVAAAVRTRSPRIEPETSTRSTTARRVRTRSRTTMSSSCGPGARRALEGAVEVDVVGPALVADAGELTAAAAADVAPGTRIASRAAICRARRRTSGSGAASSGPRSSSCPAPRSTPLPCCPGSWLAAWRPAIAAGKTRPPGRRGRTRAVRLLIQHLRAAPQRLSRLPARRAGGSACPRGRLFNPAPRPPGPRMKWSSQICRSTASGLGRRSRPATCARTARPPSRRRRRRVALPRLGRFRWSEVRSASSSSRPATRSRSIAPRTLLPWRTSSCPRVALVRATASADEPVTQCVRQVRQRGAQHHDPPLRVGVLVADGQPAHPVVHRRRQPGRAHVVVRVHGGDHAERGPGHHGVGPGHRDLPSAIAVSSVLRVSSGARLNSSMYRKPPERIASSSGPSTKFSAL